MSDAADQYAAQMRGALDAHLDTISAQLRTLAGEVERCKGGSTPQTALVMRSA